jgi:outer membrane murein-binding lipoprotein Lpp
METLATGFGEFAEKMALFEQYGEIDTSGLEKAIDAVQHAYKSSFTISIVNAIGYLTSGKSYVEQLCNDMDDLATSVKSFSEKLANFEGPSEADAEAFKAALAKAEEVLDGVDLSHVLSNVTTWLDADAKSTIGRFASDVRELSSAMNTFTINLRGFKPPAEEDVTAFKEAIGKAKTSIQSVMEDEDKGIGALWNSMRDWAKNASTADGQSYVAQFSSNITALSGALLQWNTDMEEGRFKDLFNFNWLGTDYTIYLAVYRDDPSTVVVRIRPILTYQRLSQELERITDEALKRFKYNILDYPTLDGMKLAVNERMYREYEEGNTILHMISF